MMGDRKRWQALDWDLFENWEACIEKKIASVYFLHASDNTVGYEMVTMVTYLARQTEMAVYIFKGSTPYIYSHAQTTDFSNFTALLIGMW